MLEPSRRVPIVAETDVLVVGGGPAVVGEAGAARGEGAVAFDPDAWKRVSNDMLRDADVELRLHSWFSNAILDGDRVTGAIFETPAGRQAIRAKVVVDACGDAAVAAQAGAPVEQGRYFV